MVHKIHIPVMGICYTADTPIRVAHFGITSVISLVDDGLLEEYRMAYAERLGLMQNAWDLTWVLRRRPGLGASVLIWILWQTRWSASSIGFVRGGSMAGAIRICIF